MKRITLLLGIMVLAGIVIGGGLFVGAQDVTILTEPEHNYTDSSGEYEFVSIAENASQQHLVYGYDDSFSSIDRYNTSSDTKTQVIYPYEDINTFEVLHKHPETDENTSFVASMQDGFIYIDKIQWNTTSFSRFDTIDLQGANGCDSKDGLDYHPTAIGHNGTLAFCTQQEVTINGETGNIFEYNIDTGSISYSSTFKPYAGEYNLEGVKYTQPINGQPRYVNTIAHAGNGWSYGVHNEEFDAIDAISDYGGYEGQRDYEELFVFTQHNGGPDWAFQSQPSQEIKEFEVTQAGTRIIALSNGGSIWSMDFYKYGSINEFDFVGRPSTTIDYSHENHIWEFWADIGAFRASVMPWLHYDELEASATSESYDSVIRDSEIGHTHMVVGGNAGIDVYKVYDECTGVTDIEVSVGELVEGEIKDYTLNGVDMNGNEVCQISSNDATVQIQNQSVAVLHPNNRIEGVGVGDTTMEITWGSETYYGDITVSVDYVTDISVEPGNNYVIPYGENIGYEVLAEYKSGSTDDITSEATTISKNQTVAQVKGQQIQANNPGTALINASYEAFTPIGQEAYVMLREGNITLLSTIDNSILTNFNVPIGQGDSFRDMYVSNDNNYVYVSTDSKITKWDFSGNKIWESPSPANMGYGGIEYRNIYDYNGQSIIVSSRDSANNGNAFFVSLHPETGSILETKENAGDRVRVYNIYDNKLLTSTDNTIEYRNPNDFTILNSHNVGDRVSHAVTDENENRIVTGATDQFTILDSTFTEIYSNGNTVSGLAINQNNKTIYVGDQNLNTADDIEKWDYNGNQISSFLYGNSCSAGGCDMTFVNERFFIDNWNGLGEHDLYIYNESGYSQIDIVGSGAEKIYRDYWDLQSEVFVVDASYAQTFTDEQLITVQQPKPRSINVELSSVSTDLSTDIDYQIFVTYQDGTEKDVTTDLNTEISVQNPSIFTVNEPQQILEPQQNGSTYLIVNYTDRGKTIGVDQWVGVNEDIPPSEIDSMPFGEAIIFIFTFPPVVWLMISIGLGAYGVREYGDVMVGIAVLWATHIIGYLVQSMIGIQLVFIWQIVLLLFGSIIYFRYGGNNRQFNISLPNR